MSDCVATYIRNSWAIDDPFEVHFEPESEEGGEVEFLSVTNWRSLLETQIWFTCSSETITTETTGEYGAWMSELSTGGVRWRTLPIGMDTAQVRKNAAARRLLRSWLDDHSGYDEKAWPLAKAAIEAHRLSTRKRFSD